MRILCYGDSNTWGYDPRDPWGGLYPKGIPWPNRLAEQHPDWELINEGLNGREIPHTASARQTACRVAQWYAPLDVMIVMLGTNDLLNGCCPDAAQAAEAVAQRMDGLLAALVPGCLFPGNILLLAPPPLELPGGDAWNTASRLLGPAYRALAEQYGTRFADAAAWRPALAFDGVHLSPEGHARMADGLAGALAQSCGG